MEPTEAYSFGLGALSLVFMFINFRPYFTRILEIGHVWTSEWLIFPQLLDRHPLVGPWSALDVAVQVVYTGANLFCIWFQATSAGVRGLRAAKLSLINMVPLLAGPHLSFLADLLGIPLRTFRNFHGSAGCMSFVLLCFHALTVVFTRVPFSLHVDKNRFGLIVSLLDLTRYLRAG